MGYLVVFISDKSAIPNKLWNGYKSSTLKLFIRSRYDRHVNISILKSDRLEKHIKNCFYMYIYSVTSYTLTLYLFIHIHCIFRHIACFNVLTPPPPHTHTFLYGWGWGVGGGGSQVRRGAKLGCYLSLFKFVFEVNQTLIDHHGLLHTNISWTLLVLDLKEFNFNVVAFNGWVTLKKKSILPSTLDGYI